MTRDDIAAMFPEAAARCTELRALFGADARLTWAKNAQGDEIGRPQAGPRVIARIFLTLELERERTAAAREADPWVSRIRYDRRTSL